MRRQHQRPAPTQYRELVDCAGESHEGVRIEYCSLGDLHQSADQLPPAPLAAQTWSDRQRVCFLYQLEQSARGRLVEGLCQGLQIGLGLHQRGYCLCGSYRVDQARATGECRPGCHAQSTRHTGSSPDDDYPSAFTFVVSCPKPSEPIDCLEVGGNGRPPGVGWRMTDVDDDDGSHLVTGQEVTPSQTPEGNRQICAGWIVHHAGLKIHAGRSVDRKHRHLEIMDARYQSRYGWPRCAGGSCTEQGINGQAYTGPGSIGGDLTHSIGAGQPGHVFP
jgi:hypothetical protein